MPRKRLSQAAITAAGIEVEETYTVWKRKREEQRAKEVEASNHHASLVCKPGDSWWWVSMGHGKSWLVLGKVTGKDEATAIANGQKVLAGLVRHPMMPLRVQQIPQVKIRRRLSK